MAVPNLAPALQEISSMFCKAKTNQKLFLFCFSFSLLYSFTWLLLSIWLDQKERARRDDFLVWTFLNNENLAGRLYEHLPRRSLTSWQSAGKFLLQAAVLPNCNQNSEE